MTQAAGDELDTVRALLPDTRLTALDLLGGSSRSRVRRVRADDRTLIVKEFTGAGEGWALSVLPRQVHAPRLVAAGADPPTVVMSDLGTGPSVADALPGDDPAPARPGPPVRRRDTGIGGAVGPPARHTHRPVGRGDSAVCARVRAHAPMTGCPVPWHGGRVSRRFRTTRSC